jgi:tetratricopeptide (TPR) repeat protein
VSRHAVRVAFVILFCFALLASARAGAHTAEAMTRFTEARAAFEAEDYSRARALYEQALAAGMEGPAIHYNIGAAAYLAGNLPRAESAFREVARTPSMAALAYYNLGIVAQDRNDEREARQWFERAFQDSPNERLTVLASQRLAELPEARAPGAWSYYSRGGVGYDDNVSLRSNSIESAPTGDADSYAELIFAGSYSFGGWRVDTGAAMLEYLDLEEYGQSVFSLGAARGFRWDDWYFELGAFGSQLSLGGEAYEQDLGAGLQAVRTFFGGSRLRALLRATSVAGKDAFTGLTGDRAELGLYYEKVLRKWSLGAHTRAELNESEDPIFATRWVQLGAEARYAWSPFWEVTAIAALRRIRHAAQPEVPGGWDDNRATLQLGVTRTLWRRARLFVRGELQRSDSPVAGYDYERNWVAASVEMWR